MNKDIKKKEEKCNHNLKDDNNTLKKINHRNMVYPPVDEFICTVCHNFFEFNK